MSLGRRRRSYGGLQRSSATLASVTTLQVWQGVASAYTYSDQSTLESYDMLVMEGWLQSDDTTSSDGENNFNIEVNGDTTNTNYDVQYLTVANTIETAIRTTGRAQGHIHNTHTDRGPSFVRIYFLNPGNSRMSVCSMSHGIRSVNHVAYRHNNSGGNLTSVSVSPSGSFNFNSLSKLRLVGINLS